MKDVESGLREMFERRERDVAGTLIPNHGRARLDRVLD